MPCFSFQWAGLGSVLGVMRNLRGADVTERSMSCLCVHGACLLSMPRHAAVGDWALYAMLSAPVLGGPDVHRCVSMGGAQCTVGCSCMKRMVQGKHFRVFGRAVGEKQQGVNSVGVRGVTCSTARGVYR